MTPATAISFDELAEPYDRYRIGYSDEVYETLFEWGVRAGARVLDVGCGTGLVTAALAQRGCVVTGIDVSEPMIERARARVAAGTFVLARAEDLPFPDNTFDSATSAQAFHWVDQPRALGELARVVRPGGTVAIWWKGLMRGDATRCIREQVARGLGLAAPGDLLAADFRAFGEAGFDDERLRVIPWCVTMSVRDYLGYERSRARARDAYGPALDAYFEALAERLGPPAATLTLSYLHMLYLGRVPAVSGRVPAGS